MKSLKFTSILVALCTITFISSCDKDDDGCTDPNALNYDSSATNDDGSCNYESSSAPTTYNYTNASYGGQVDRINMLKELETYLKTVSDGAVIDADLAKSMYANDGYTWTSESFALEQPTKDLKSKTHPDDQAIIETLIDELAMLSANAVPCSDDDTYIESVLGAMGISTCSAVVDYLMTNYGYTEEEACSWDGSPMMDLGGMTVGDYCECSCASDDATSLTGNYMFNENGFEPVQLIVKGIMGSCFYYQGTSVYLSDAKMNVDNDVAALTGDLEYTDMQHHFDESFGYLGAPVDMSIVNPDGGSYWGKYAKKTTAGGLLTIDNLMQDGFIAGRHAINNMDYDARDQAISVIQTEWEMIPVASALYYLNASEANIADDATRNHALSEAIAFLSALKWNSNATITPSEVDAIIAMLGDNLFNISATMIADTRNALASAYGISNPTEF